MIQTIIVFLFSYLFLKSETANIIQTYRTAPHNKNCYSQGIFFLNNTHVFQSCGMYELSYFHVLQYISTDDKFQLKQVFQSQIPFKRNVFLQGAAVYNDHIFILTWRQHIVYKLNRQDFSMSKQLAWEKAGWGLTSNLTHMFITDGTDKIFLCRQNQSMIQIIQSKTVVDQAGRSVYNLNELEMIDGYLWMNVYMTNRILKVDYQSGKVLEQFDARRLDGNEKGHKYDEVLNGIAYNQQNKMFLMTGKYWKNYYEVQLQ